MVRYCHTDTAAELALHRRVNFLPRSEHAVWLLDQSINRRGVALDLAFVEQASRIVQCATGPLVEQFMVLTGGLKPSQATKVVEWCRDKGTVIPDLQKETVAAVQTDAIHDDASIGAVDGKVSLRNVG